MEIKYIEREVTKILKKSIFVVFKLSIFMGIITKTKGTWNYIPVPFQLAKMFGKSVSLDIHHLAICDALIKRVFELLQNFNW